MHAVVAGLQFTISKKALRHRARIFCGVDAIESLQEQSAVHEVKEDKKQEARIQNLYRQLSHDYKYLLNEVYAIKWSGFSNSFTRAMAHMSLKSRRTVKIGFIVRIDCPEILSSFRREEERTD